MRDPKRIARMIEKLRVYWLAHPDLRLGQLIVNCIPAVSGPTFYVEDDIVEAGLTALLKGERPDGR